MSIAAKVREAVARLHARQSYIPANHVRRAPETRPPPDTGREDTYREALQALRDKPFCQGVKYTEQQMRADRDGAHPDILWFERTFVARMKRLDVPLFAATVWRGKDDQNAAYVKGVSKARYPYSPHNKGCAVDIVHGTKGWDLSERQWAIIGHIGHEIAAANGLKLTWGGKDHADDKFGWDPAHWELSDWRDIRISPR